MLNNILVYIRTKIGTWPFMFAFMMTAKVLGFSIGPVDMIDFGLMLLAALYAYKNSQGLDQLSLLLICYIPIALFLAQPDPVFKSWSRFSIFVFLYMVCSPLIKGKITTMLRWRVLQSVIILSAVVGMVCFFCYFLDINMMRNTYTGQVIYDFIENNAGTFGGICCHSMLMGPVAAIGALGSSYLALSRSRNIYWACAVMCMGSVLFSASRSTFIAVMIGAIILFRFFARAGNRFIGRIVIVIGIAVATYPLWEGALDGLNAKNRGDISEGIDTNSRSEKWGRRLSEFNSSPIWGVGFVSVKYAEDYAPSTGGIEPGSSWLGVLSMEGIIGFVLFSMIFYRAWKNATRYRTPEGALLAAVLVFVGVHMIAEGHIFSGGSFLCFLVWLIIGCCTYYAPNVVEK